MLIRFLNVNFLIIFISMENITIWIQCGFENVVLSSCMFKSNQFKYVLNYVFIGVLYSQFLFLLHCLYSKWRRIVRLGCSCTKTIANAPLQMKTPWTWSHPKLDWSVLPLRLHYRHRKMEFVKDYHIL